MIKRCASLLFLLCGFLAAQTTTTITRDPDGSTTVTFKNVSVPTSPTSVTTSQYRVQYIVVVNNNGSAVHCTIKDQDTVANGGAASLIPDSVAIAANTQFVWGPLNVVANGGITWSCDTSLVVGRIVVKP